MTWHGETKTTHSTPGAAVMLVNVDLYLEAGGVLGGAEELSVWACSLFTDPTQPGPRRTHVLAVKSELTST